MIFLPFSQPNTMVRPVIAKYMISPSFHARLKFILNTNSPKRNVAKNERNIPESEARLPKKKYSKVLIWVTIAELAPKVLNKILSRIRWYLLIISELISTKIPVAIEKKAI